jgi:hypothetical protein
MQFSYRCKVNRFKLQGRFSCMVNRFCAFSDQFCAWVTKMQGCLTRRYGAQNGARLIIWAPLAQKLAPGIDLPSRVSLCAWVIIQWSILCMGNHPVIDSVHGDIQWSIQCVGNLFDNLVHYSFPSLRRTYRSIPEEVARLKHLLTEHLRHIAPEHIAATPRSRGERARIPSHQNMAYICTHPPPI